MPPRIALGTTLPMSAPANRTIAQTSADERRQPTLSTAPDSSSRRRHSGTDCRRRSRRRPARANWRCHWCGTLCRDPPTSAVRLQGSTRRAAWRWPSCRIQRQFQRCFCAITPQSTSCRKTAERGHQSASLPRLGRNQALRAPRRTEAEQTHIQKQRGTRRRRVAARGGSAPSAQRAGSQWRRAGRQ